MFKFLWKMIKWSAIIVVVSFITVMFWPKDEQKLADCHSTHGEQYCDMFGNERDKATVDAEIAKAKQEEKAKHDAEIAKLKAEMFESAQKAEESRISKIETNGRLMCRHTVKQKVKYPSKIDYDWSYDEKLWENFNKADASYPHRYVWNASGEMMNGFGNMIPFTVHCKIDLPTNGNGKIVDFWIK